MKWDFFRERKRKIRFNGFYRFYGFNGFLSNLSLHFDSSESYDKIRIMYATNDGDW